MPELRRHLGSDGLELGVWVVGSGAPLLCLPGGPGNSADYLGELAGLGSDRQLLLLDPRGTGASAARTEPGSLGLDGLVADIEAVRTAEGLERLAVLAHSAGGRVALEWAARHPDRVAALVLVTCVARWDDAVDADRVAVGGLRRAEPWYPEAEQAGLAIAHAKPAERRRLELLTRPFWYARWGEREQAHSAALDSTLNVRAALQLRADLRRRALPDLAQLRAPTLLVAGELDTAAPPPSVRRLADRVPGAQVVVLPGVSHFPWIDDGPAFRRLVADFLTWADPQRPESAVTGSAGR